MKRNFSKWAGEENRKKYALGKSKKSFRGRLFFETKEIQEQKRKKDDEFFTLFV